MIGNIHWSTFFVMLTTYCSAAFIGFFLSVVVYSKIKEQKRKARIVSFDFEEDL